MAIFSPEIVHELDGPLARENVKTRSQAGRKLPYVEGLHVIAEANRIFGFDAWTRETIDLKVVAEHPRKIGQDKRDGFGVSYIAKVRVTVLGVVREGVGAGHGIDVDLGLAHESAIKECETDSMKRAFMSFGNPFGLALYDKEQSNVESTPPKPKDAAPVTTGKPNGGATSWAPNEKQRKYADELIAWFAKAKRNEKPTNDHVAQVRGVWNEEIPSMKELGILGTPLEKELREVWMATGIALANAAGNPQVPAN